MIEMHFHQCMHQKTTTFMLFYDACIDKKYYTTNFFLILYKKTLTCQKDIPSQSPAGAFGNCGPSAGVWTAAPLTSPA